MDLNGLLTRAVELGASDVHLKVGQPPVLRLDGDLGPLEGHAPLDDAAHSEVLAIVGRRAPASTPTGSAAQSPSPSASSRRRCRVSSSSTCRRASRSSPKSIAD